MEHNRDTVKYQGLITGVYVVAVKVRVRGIYATAISKMLVNEGYTLVDVSDVLVERLRVPPNKGLPADVTVKTDNDDASKILVIGHYEHSESVARTITREVPATISHTSPIGLYATLIARVKGLREGRCFVETPYGPAELIEYRECKEGNMLPVSVIRVPMHPKDAIVVVPGVRVVGDFAVVWRGSRVMFSPHIRNKSRVSELLALSSKYVRRGLSIKWRSNSDEADLEAITTELPKLIGQLERIEEETKVLKDVSVVTNGERIISIFLTYDAKLHLDSYRRAVAPTVDYHHIIKTSRGLYRDVAELLDEISNQVSRDLLRGAIRKFVAKVAEEVGEISIYHRKLDGRYIRLGSASIGRISYDGRLELELLRRIRSGGAYDGLGVRKEPGDIVKTVVWEGVPYIVHYYFNGSGELKGIYINFNTKPEIIVPNIVEYIDLSIDLVRASNSSCELVDQEELRSLIMDRFTYLSQEIYEYVVNGLEEALSNYCGVEQPRITSPNLSSITSTTSRTTLESSADESTITNSPLEESST